MSHVRGGRGHAKIDLGFGEPFTNRSHAKCKYFPSKIGGRPAFLALNPILGPKELTCLRCHRVMRFILQLYAPIESEPDAFHRSIFVFACGRTKECENQFAVFRTQLPQINRFYSDVPPDYERTNEDDDEDERYDPNPAKFDVRMCPICGVGAPHRCARCQQSSYCSREHQIIHWKFGGHKETCGGDGAVDGETKLTDAYEGLIFPELDLVIDRNDDDDNDDDADEDVTDVTESEMSKYRQYLERNRPTLQNENLESYTGGNRNGNDSSSSKDNVDLSLNDDENEEEEQRVFERFKKLSKQGESIRYRADWYRDSALSVNDDILWISNRNRITDSSSSSSQSSSASSCSSPIPACERCGSERRFEFQIMPQLLNELLIGGRTKRKSSKIIGDDGEHLDWGTLLVFSCPKSCGAIERNGDSNENRHNSCVYMREFIYNQPIS